MTPRLRLPRLLACVTALSLGLAACAGGSSVPSKAATPSPLAAVSPPAPSTSPCPSSAPATAELGRLARFGPATGVWVGMNLDWGSETVADTTSQLGRPPATVVTFVAFPLTASDIGNLDAAAGQARDAGAVLIVTLEPWGGLASVTDAAVTDLAQLVAGFGAEGVPTIVRFAHEMNGSWYPWSQDPDRYVATFRRVAAIVHATAPTAAMLWAPNQGDGYPYTGGASGAKVGSAASKALDTNRDGRLGPGDDPYGPYWPGASYVDWVGISLYHWGTTYPWGANVVPAPGKFRRLITGSASSDGSSTPDFYSDYAERYAKPLAVVETAAFFRPGGGGAAEMTIKSAWLAQVFSADTRTSFPLLRILNWFEWRKLESEVDAVVDWRVAAEASTRAAFLAEMTDGFSLGPALTRSALPEGCIVP